MEEGVEPKLGPKLLELYNVQDQAHVREGYSSVHLENYIKYAALQPVPGELLHKGRHRQEAGHDDCTSCHFCRQCTEDSKPRCVSCGKCFCAPCLANRFGQNAAEMMRLSSWVCPVCLDFCNCSGATCRRAQHGLEPTASLIHEAQAFGYSSVAEYLIVTALYRDGSSEEASRAVTWLVNPQRQFHSRPFTLAARGSRVQPRIAQLGNLRGVLSDRNADALHTVAAKQRRPALTAEERVSKQLNHLTSQLGFLSMQGLMSEVEALMPAIGYITPLSNDKPRPSRNPASEHGPRPGGAVHQPQNPILLDHGVNVRGSSIAVQRTLRAASNDARAAAQIHTGQQNSDLHHAPRVAAMPHQIADHSAQRPLGGSGGQMLPPGAATTSERLATRLDPEPRGRPWQSAMHSSVSRPPAASAQSRGEQALVLPRLGPRHDMREANTWAAPQHGHAAMTANCVGSRVSDEAAAIWQRYEADLDRRHGQPDGTLAAPHRGDSSGRAAAQQPAAQRQINAGGRDSAHPGSVAMAGGPEHPGDPRARVPVRHELPPQSMTQLQPQNVPAGLAPMPQQEAGRLPGVANQAPAPCFATNAVPAWPEVRAIPIHQPHVATTSTGSGAAGSAQAVPSDAITVVEAAPDGVARFGMPEQPEKHSDQPQPLQDAPNSKQNDPAEQALAKDDSQVAGTSCNLTCYLDCCFSGFM
eukprot:jgi/Ulvmu1/9264/UM050_0013.1